MIGVRWHINMRNGARNLLGPLSPIALGEVRIVPSVCRASELLATEQIVDERARSMTARPSAQIQIQAVA
jgi:hypothetical protein